MRDNNLRGEESLGETEELTEAERYAATLTVCRQATDAEDAGELLAMLGLTGTSTRIADKCRGCGRPTSNLALIGHARRSGGGGGLCQGCRNAADKAGGGQ
ncbi:hypothetical protein [Nocardia fluminea]|uniref:hypothetical protein n=1 Tax=Nocardia fluminea TaxID=134984 RepID=UPI003647730D